MTSERTFRKAADPHLIGMGEGRWVRRDADYLKMAELPKVGRENQS